MYSFWWSEVRLLIAAAALFIGGVPPLYLIMPPSMFGLTILLLKASWIISGLAAGYLLYRWYDEGQELFGHKDHKDTLAFLVLAVSGLNLGFAGVFGRNIGMSISTNHVVLIVVGIVYLLAAWQLWMHSQKHKGGVF
jgi:hypothetical protein